MLKIKLSSTEINNLNHKPALRLFRDLRECWETITTRDTDSSDERVNDEGMDYVISSLQWYMSDNAQIILYDWLCQVIYDRSFYNKWKLKVDKEKKYQGKYRLVTIPSLYE